LSRQGVDLALRRMPRTRLHIGGQGMTHTTSLDRRDFLAGATGTLTGLLALGSPLALIAPTRAWAVDLKSLTSAEGVTLMAMVRTIAPHDALEDAAYALVVQALDADAAHAAATRQVLKDGIAGLGSGFATAAESARVAALKSLESSVFFQSTRQKTLQVLYSNPIAYAHFGYEGEAFSKGGYLLRGFNNLRWLPEVPLADGGPLPVSA
jgi:hypothetical protein